MQGKYMYEAHCSKNGKIKRTNVTVQRRIIGITIMAIKALFLFNSNSSLFSLNEFRIMISSLMANLC